MKQLIIISILSFFLAGSSFGQEFKPVEDSISIKKFNVYVNSILALKKDSIFPDLLPNNYKIVYKTSCPNSEFIYGGETFYFTSGKSFINDFKAVKTDSNYVIYPGIKEQQNKPFVCADNPSMPIGGKPVSVSKTKKFITDSLEIASIQIDNLNVLYGYFKYRTGISFNENKFLIIEHFLIGSIGSQTSYGITETLFLERIE